MVSNTSFSGCLEFVSESSVPPSLGVCPSRHIISLILPSLGVMLRIPNALHLPVAHTDDITRLIAICNKPYKFVAYPYSILQEFTVDNRVIAYELDSPWDPGIDSVFSQDDAPHSTPCSLIVLLSSTTGLPWRPAPPPPPWSRHDVPLLLPRPPPWPD